MRCSAQKRIPIRDSQSGFTLVELLIVIAIIGVLATILLAATSKMTEMGNRAVCVGNLRQIAAAWQGYLADNKYIFPGNYTPMPDDGGVYEGYWMYGGGGGISSEKYSSSSNRWLSPYLAAGKVWRCNSDGRGIGVPGLNYVMYGNSYAWNLHGLYGNGNAWHWSSLTIENKSRKWLVADAAIFARPPAWPSYKLAEGHTLGPNAHFNMAFVDGHVAWVQDDEAKAPTGLISPGNDGPYKTRDFDW